MNHGIAYEEMKDHFVNLHGLQAWNNRHRPGRLDCPCGTCLDERGPVAERKNWAGYTLREIGAA